MNKESIQLFNAPVDTDTAGDTTPIGLEKLKHVEGEDSLLLLLEPWDEIRKLDIKVEWLVDRLIPKESVTVIHGRGGVGKTWLALDMARNIGNGTPFAGHASLKTPVIYVDLENPLSVLSTRMKKLGDGEGVHFWRVNNEGLKPPKLDSDGWEIYKSLPKGSIIIFDTLRASHSGDENSSSSIGVVMGRLKELRDMGFSIILLHHTPKHSDTTAKGSTSIVDLGDHILSLTKKELDGWEIPDGDGNGKKHDAVYNFGVIGKTRYEPYQVCLTFDPEKGFELAPDPKRDTSRQDNALGKMYRVLIESGGMNKTDFLKCCGEAKIGSRQELSTLFEAGTGKYWMVETGAHNAHRVKQIKFNSLPAPYSPEKQENCEEAAGNDYCSGTEEGDKAGAEASASLQDALGAAVTDLSGVDNPSEDEGVFLCDSKRERLIKRPRIDIDEPIGDQNT